MFRIANGLVVNGGIVEKKNVYIDGGVIAAVTDAVLPADKTLDAEGKYVSAGFIDTHVHGGGGSDFMDGGTEPMRVAARTHLAHGTTSIAPTSMACAYPYLKKAVLDYKELTLESGVGGMPNLIGMHLEGPYFSPAQAGAQPPEYIYPPKKSEYDEIIAIAEGNIAKWSFAPELPGSVEFCDTLVKNGILPSVGHSDACYDDVLAVYRHGAMCMTHFYSGMSGITRKMGYRVPGVIESGYLLDDMWIEIIGDGSHIPPILLKMIVKNRGTDRIILVTDAMRGATMPEGPSILGTLDAGIPCIIEDGIAKMPDRTCFAGSVATTDRLVRTFYKNGIVPLADAVRMMTENPAKSLGLSKKGRLAEGFDADVVIFDDDINVSTVIVGGQIVKS